jgi:hypothetical protein
MEEFLGFLLESQRWGPALSLLRILVEYLEGNAKLFPYQRFISKCEASARLGSKPATLSLIDARLFLAMMMSQDLEMVVEAKQQLEEINAYMATIDWILPEHLQRRMFRRLKIDAYPPSALEPVNELITLGATSQSDGDSLMEIQILSRILHRMNQVDILRRDDAWTATQSNVLARHSELHSDLRGRALLVTAPLWRFANMLGGSTAKAGEYLQRFAKFQMEYPDFDLPTVQRDLFRAAANALHSLGREDEAQIYEARKIVALSNCPLDPSQFFRVYRDKPFDDWAPYVMGFILNWIKLDLEAGIISIDEVARMLLIGAETSDLSQSFGPVVPLNLLVEDYLLRPPESIANRLIGMPDPVDYDEWGARFQRFEIWLSDSPKTVERSIRHTILGDFQRVRCVAVFKHVQRAMFDLAKLGNEELQLDVRLLKRAENIRLLELVRRLDRKAMGAAEHDIESQAWVCMGEWSQLATSFRAFKTGFIKDSHLSDAQRFFEHSFAEAKTNDLTRKLASLSQVSILQRQRYTLFGTVASDACLDTFMTYDQIYMQERVARSVLKGSDNLMAGTNLVSEWSFSNHYDLAMGMIVEALGVGHVRKNYHRTIHQDMQFEPAAAPYIRRTPQMLFSELVEWTQRKKARSVTEALGAELIITPNILPYSELDDKARELLHREAEYQMQLYNNQGDQEALARILEKIRQEMRNCSGLMQLMDLRDGRALTESQIHAFAQRLGPDVLIVDYLYLPQEFTGMSCQIVPMIYKRGKLASCRFVTQLSHEILQRWVRTHILDEEIREPFSGDGDPSALQYLYPLIDAAVKFSEPGNTILICPTDILFNIPFHAIELPDGEPWIQRNPIVYTQSLSIQRLCHVSASAANPSEQVKPLAVQALSDEDLANPNAADMAFASRIHANLLKGPDLTKESFLAACKKSRLIHFYGHVCYDDQKPLDQHLAIRDLDTERVTVREIFDLRLRSGTHVNLIGCQSGRSQIGLNDDLLGFSTAFLYAGAASIVMALWSIYMEDAAAFQEAFYDEVIAQSRQSMAQRENEAEMPKALNLALALQKAVLTIRLDSAGRPRAPYHWAAFLMQGCWDLFPPLDV